MDFQRRYTEEQKRLRDEVAAWLDANLVSLSPSADGGPAARERPDELRRKLGEKGWLLPTCPVQWGGLGLTPAHAAVIEEELRERGLGWTVESGAPLLLKALQGWGTEEQRRRHLPVVSAGKATVARLFMEPGAELDLDNLHLCASRDRDGFILDGEGFFLGGDATPDYLWTLAVTDAHARAQRSVGMFLLPARWPGISVQGMNLLTGEGGRRVVFDGARVPADCLIGGESDGWAAAAATLLAEDGAFSPPTMDRLVTDLFRYARETRRGGVPLSQDPILQQLLVEAYIDGEIGRLFKTRNDWMGSTGQELTHQEAQHRLWAKRAALRLSEIVREVLGPYALLDRGDSRSPFHGEFELHQRQSLAAQNPGGGPEVQAAFIAKRLGLAASERREAAAETEKVRVLSGYEAVSAQQRGG